MNYRDEIIGLVKWTMCMYGSDAGEAADPGSKLQSQAAHIADRLIERERIINKISDVDLHTKNISVNIDVSLQNYPGEFDGLDDFVKSRSRKNKI